MFEISKDISKYASILPVFGMESYLKTLSNNYGWCVSDKFILPFIIRKRYIFHYLTFTHQTIHIGQYSEEEEKKFLNEAVDYFSRKKIDFITQPPTNVVFTTAPDNCTNILFGSYILDLALSEETLLNNIQSRPRRYIKNAINYDITVETGNHLLNICHSIIFNTLSLHGVSFMTIKEFGHFSDILKNNIAFFACKRNNIYEAALIILFDTSSANCMYGGKISDAHNASNYVLHWEAIKFFKHNHLKYFNFIGARINPDKNSKYYKIQEFKTKFGPKACTRLFMEKNI